MTTEQSDRPDGLGTSPDAVLLPGFAGVELPEWLAARLRRGLAGVCLFASNIESPRQLKDLTTAIRGANPLAIIAVDEEGGDVTRLHHREGAPYPGNAILGRIDDLDVTESVGRAVGEQLRAAGITLDLAPDADVNSNQDNPVIGVRSFGADPARVGRHTAAWTTGVQSVGVAACAKHFPGHGDTATDSHLALPVVDRSLEQLRRRELVPFEYAIRAGVGAVMTSHILLPQLDPDAPATFSTAVLGGVLRDELGFDGLIVSDALDMVGASGEFGIPEAAVRSIVAGCDLLCIGTDNTDDELDRIGSAISEAISSERIGLERWGDAVARVLSLGQHGRNMPFGEYDATDTVGTDAIIASFDIRPGTVPPSAPITIALRTAANVAVGAVPWGLAAAGLSVLSVGDEDPLPDPAQRALLVVGQGNHRFAWVRDMIDDLRRRYPRTVVVDMGWPSEDRAYADVATFGASRLVGVALARWLDGGR